MTFASMAWLFGRAAVLQQRQKFERRMSFTPNAAVLGAMFDVCEFMETHQLSESCRKEHDKFGSMILWSVFMSNIYLSSIKSEGVHTCQS